MDPTLAIANDPPTMLTLPQEIQDMIFQLAYAPCGKLTLAGKDTWAIREKERRREQKKTYVARPFPPPKVNEFLVSKTFFVNAAKAYMGGTVVCGPNDTASTALDPDICDGIGRAFMKHVATGLYSAFSLNELRSLQTLTLSVGEYHFASMPFEPHEAEMSVEDMRSVTHVDTLLDIRGLTAFKLDATWHGTAISSEERATWEDNMKRLEQMISSWVTQRRTGPPMPHHHNPRPDQTSLYIGSKVSATGPRLLSRESDWMDRYSNTDLGLDTLFGSTTYGGAAAKVLTDAEVPDNLSDITTLVLTRGEEFTKWLRDVKKRASGGD